MSTYTDLHNRVQESINVDYNSRETPQKVKLFNVENEYWGTFNGNLSTNNISVVGGTLEDVTIKDAVLDGVTLKNTDLQIDLDDYAKSVSVIALDRQVQEINAAQADVLTAAQNAIATINNTIEHVDNIRDALDSRITSVESNVASYIGSIDTNVDGKIIGLSGELKGDLNALDTKFTTSCNAIKERINEKDNIADRKSYVDAVSTYLNNALTGGDDRLSNAVNLSVSNLIDCIGNETTARTTAIGVEQLARQTQDTNLELSIGAERTARENAVATLNGAIGDEQTARQNADSDLLTTLQTVSNDLETAINTADTGLQNALDLSVFELNKNIDSEAIARIRADGVLQQQIDDAEQRCIDADQQIAQSLSETSTILSAAIDTTEADVLSILEHDRHYILNHSVSGYSTTDTYPLIAKDMAVNVYDMNLADGKVVFEDVNTGVSVEVGEILFYSADPLSIAVKTYAGIKNDAIVSSLTENATFVFSTAPGGSLEYSTGKNYKFQFVPATEVGSSWTDGKFRLVPDVVNFHYIRYGSQIIGKVYDAQIVDNEIVSGKYKFYSAEVDLSAFNKYDGTPFNKSDLSDQVKDTERVIYNGHNQIVLQRGIDNTPYNSLIAANTGDGKEFGRIYEHIGVEHGVDIENGQLKKVRVDVTNLSIAPVNATTYLRAESGFSAVVSADVQKSISSSKLYNYYMSADVSADAGSDDISAKFTLFNAAKLYSYAFEHEDLNGDDEEIISSYVTPILYNKTIASGQPFLCAEVDLTKVPVIDIFRKKYMLQKVLGKNEWAASEEVENGSKINISYNIASLYVNYSTAADKTVVYHKYDVAQTPSKDGLDPEDIEIVYVTDPIVLTQYSSSTGIPTASYDVTIDSTSQTTEMTEYNLGIDTSENNIVKIVVPNKKTDYSQTAQISREFLVVIRMNNAEAEAENVKIVFVTEDGQEIRFYNNKKPDLYLSTKSWTTLQLNEIKPNRFLVTDLNQNEDRLNFRQIFARLEQAESAIDVLELSATDLDSRLTAEVDARTTAVNALDTNIQTVSGNLNTAIARMDVFKLDAETGELSAASISSNDAYAANFTANAATITSLSVSALSNVIDSATTSSLQDTVNDLTTQISSTSATLNGKIDNTSSTLDGRIDAVSGVVKGALSAACTLPQHDMVNQDALTAVVSKLLLVDEVTYDVYALTMRNGALNVDKLGAWPNAHNN